MQITVFTSNQARHTRLIRSLAEIADHVFAIQECNTVFPGHVDDFFRRSPVMRDYFQRVLDAERKVFGTIGFTPENVQSLPIRMGDVSRLPEDVLAQALRSDLFVVFGASYIRGPLCDCLVARGAVNLHMGVSPFYRGSSTNFWAMADGHPEYVGATIHRLTSALDAGPILTHAFPKTQPWDAFELGMRAVESGQQALVDLIRSGAIDELTAVPQDRSLEIRSSRNREFTDSVAAEYLSRLPSPADIAADLSERSDRGLVMHECATANR